MFVEGKRDLLQETIGVLIVPVPGVPHAPVLRQTKIIFAGG